MNNDEISALKRELAEFRKTVNQRLDKMEAKLAGETPEAETLADEVKQVLAAKEAMTQAVKMAPAPSSLSTPTQKLCVSTQNLKQKQPPAPSKDSWLKSLFLHLLPMLIGWLEPILKMYASYKKRGLGHVFLLTIGGIGLTLVGVGYLMQLMVEQLETGAKSLLFSGVSAAVIFGGFRMHKLTVFKEYAVAIVAMGILTGYITVYFSGNVYHLLSPVSTLIAYCFIAIGCHLIARKLDANIIYSLGITGVALLPMLSAKDGHGALWYLISVCLVGCSSLWFAAKQHILWLSGLTLVGVFLACEWVGLNSVYSLLIMSTFYLLVLFQLGTFFKKFELKRVAPMLAGYTGSWATLLFQSSGEVADLTLALSAVSHAALSGYIAYYLRSPSKLSQNVFTLLSTLWLFITTVFLLGQSHWGLAWLAEGAILLYLSSRLDMKQAFISAQILMVVAIGYNFAALMPYLPRPALHTFDGWVLSLSILAGLAFWVRQLPKIGSSSKQPLGLRSILHLLESTWLCFLVLATGEFWLDRWLTPLVFLIQLSLLIWSKHLKEILVELLALCLTAIPIFIALEAFNNANSLFIGDIAWPGRIAVITIFTQMWLWAEFHRRIYSESEFSKYSETVRLFFYLLLPIFWIGSATRLLDEAVIATLWLSPLIALGLAVSIKHRILIQETKILTLAVGFALLVSSVFFNWIYALIGLAGYGVLFVGAYYCKYKLHARIHAAFLLSSIIIITGLILPTFSGVKTESLLVGLVVVAVYWLSIYLNPGKQVALKLNHQKSLIINRGIFFISLLAMSVNSWLVSVPLIYLAIGLLLHQDKLIYFSSLGWHKNSQRHALIALTYTFFIFGFGTHQAALFFGPLMAIHGVFVVLQDRSHPSVTKLGFGLLAIGIIKIAVWDVNATELWQKVLMFIGIGCFLLIASFWYQKLIIKYERSNS